MPTGKIGLKSLISKNHRRETTEPSGKQSPLPATSAPRMTASASPPRSGFSRDGAIKCCSRLKPLLRGWALRFSFVGAPLGAMKPEVVQTFSRDGAIQHCSRLKPLLLWSRMRAKAGALFAPACLGQNGNHRLRELICIELWHQAIGAHRRRHRVIEAATQ